MPQVHPVGPEPSLARAKRLGHDVTRLDSGVRGGETVQRVIQWTGANEQKTTNLSDPLLFFLDFGTTIAIVNDQEIPSADPAAAFLPPAFLHTRLPTGADRLSVAAEPINRVGVRIELPADPPWVRTVPTDQALSALGPDADGIRDAVTKAGQDNVHVHAHGLPSDAAFAQLVKNHEDVHVEHITQLIHDVLVPWDAAVAEFQAGNRTVEGANPAEAQENFYNAIGRPSAAEVGTIFGMMFRQNGLLFHDTVEGSSPTVDHATYDAPSNTIHVYWKHPLG